MDSLKSGTWKDWYYLAISDGQKSQNVMLQFEIEMQDDPPAFNPIYDDITLFEGSHTYLLDGDTRQFIMMNCLVSPSSK